MTALKTNPVRENLQAGGTSLGCFLGLESSSVAEMLGHAGFEWLMIEAEHNALDMAQVQDMIRAVNTTPAVPLVRIPSADRVFIQRVLDVGAMGIMVPMIRSLEEVRQVVQATRYPPEADARSAGCGPASTRSTTRDIFDGPIKTSWLSSSSRLARQSTKSTRSPANRVWTR